MGSNLTLLGGYWLEYQFRGVLVRYQYVFEDLLVLIQIIRSRSPEGKPIKGTGSATPRAQGDSPKPKPLQVEDSRITVEVAGILTVNGCGSKVDPI